MEGVGWISAIIIGGLAGWLAERVMKSDMGLLANIALGIVGAFVLNLILGLFTDDLGGGGWIAYLITAFVGACLLIWVARIVRGNRRRS